MNTPCSKTSLSNPLIMERSKGLYTLEVLLPAVNSHDNNIFQTADWVWVFSHRRRIPRWEKATLLFFESKSIFLSFRTANEHQPVTMVVQTNVTSVSHCRVLVYVASILLFYEEFQVPADQKLLVIENCAILNKRNVPVRWRTTLATWQVLLLLVFFWLLHEGKNRSLQ